MKKKALVILADGFEEVEAVTPIDLLRRAGIIVTVAGLQSLEIRGAHDIILKTDHILGEYKIEDYDILILPGGMPGTTNLMNSDVVLNLVRNFYNSGKLCAAICAAPQVFYKAGILEGKKYTCFPGIEKQIERANFISEAVVCDGTIITSRGVGTAIPFALTLIQHLSGKEDAHTISEKILYANHGSC